MGKEITVYSNIWITKVNNGFLVGEDNIQANQKDISVFTSIDDLCSFLKDRFSEKKESIEEKRLDRLKNIDPDQARHLFK